MCSLLDVEKMLKMLIRSNMAPFGLRFGRHEAKWFDQRAYMPPAYVLHNMLIENGSENIENVFLTGFLYKKNMYILYIYIYIYIPYIEVFAENGGLKLSFPGSCINQIIGLHCFYCP